MNPGIAVVKYTHADGRWSYFDHVSGSKVASSCSYGINGIPHKMKGKLEVGKKYVAGYCGHSSGYMWKILYEFRGYDENGNPISPYDSRGSVVDTMG